MNEPLRLLVFESRLMRAAVSFACETSERIEVVASTGTPTGALALAALLAPDVLLVGDGPLRRAPAGLLGELARAASGRQRPQPHSPVRSPSPRLDRPRARDKTARSFGPSPSGSDSI